MTAHIVGAWNWRRAVLRSNLDSTAKHVLLTLACYVSDAGEGTFPSLSTLAEACSRSRDVVKRKLRAADGKWIEKDSRFTEAGRQTSNLYHLRFPDGWGEGGVDAPGGAGAPGEGGADAPPTSLKGLRSKTPPGAKAPSGVATPDAEQEELLADDPTVATFIEAVKDFCQRTGVPRWPLKQPMAAWCRAVAQEVQYAGIDLAFETRCAADHWEPLPRTKAKKAPHMRLRNWFAIAAKRRKEDAGGGAPSFADEEAERFRKLIEEGDDE